MPILDTGDLSPCHRMTLNGRNNETFNGPCSPPNTTGACAQEQTVKRVLKRCPSHRLATSSPIDRSSCRRSTSTGSKTKLRRMKILICTKQPLWLSVSDDVTLLRLGIRSSPPSHPPRGVVPETCSPMFRYTIESMFITHAETNLNTVGNVLNPTSDGEHHPQENPWLIRGDEWCHGLVRRPEPKSGVVPSST